jgi:hypothetical protein
MAIGDHEYMAARFSFLNTYSDSVLQTIQPGTDMAPELLAAFLSAIELSHLHQAL